MWYKTLGGKKVETSEVERKAILDGAIEQVGILLKENDILSALAGFSAVLPQVSGENYTGFLYMYQIPADCLAILSLLDVSTFKPIVDEYIREGNRLYTDRPEVAVKYTHRIEFYDMDTLVQNVLILMLAYKTAYRITQDKELEQDMLNQYQKAVYDAEFADGMERINRNVDENERGWAIP